MGGRYRDMPYTHSLPLYMEPPTPSTFPTRLMFDIIDEPALTCHHHGKPIVYTRVHSWWCAFVVLNKCIMTCITITIYYTEYFHHPKNALCCTNSFFFPPTNSWKVFLSHSIKKGSIWWLGSTWRLSGWAEWSRSPSVLEWGQHSERTTDETEAAFWGRV